MDHHRLDDGDLGAVVRAGFSTLKPSPVPPSYPSPSAPVTLSPSSPVPINLSPPAISPCTSTSPAFPCFQTPTFGLPALCDLITPPSFSPHHNLSSLSQSLALIESLPSPPSLQLPSNSRRFDYAASAPSVFSSSAGHVPAVKQLELGASSTFGSRLLSHAQPSSAERVFATKSAIFSQSFLNQIVSDDPRLTKTGPSTSALSDIAALRRDVGPVSVGARQSTGAVGALEQFKDLVEAEPSSSSATNVPYKARGAKKRKAQQKRVVYIPAASAVSSRPGAGENVPSDLWAWRKYGQKPIKGSSHPRGYYRCSSSKGCPARKQVERSPNDPSMLVVTYTSDHNHPWPTHRISALAGSTRQQQSATTSSQEKSPSSNNELSPECMTNNSALSMDMEDDPHSDDLIGDASPEQAQVLEDSMESGVTPSHSQELVASGGAVDAVRETQLRACSCAEDDTYLQESMFAEMVEEMQRQSRCIEEEDVEEGGSVEVDPFNLFNWSSPNNVTSVNKVNDVAH